MKKTLLLNSTYEPLFTVTWQKAMVLVYKDKVNILKTYDEGVMTTNGIYPKPSVVILKRYVRWHRKTIRFCKDNVFGRDEYRCQYCAEKFKREELTYDHVVPKSRGGKTSWTNIVTACMKCNHKKADRTPSEANMKLLKNPVQPTKRTGLMKRPIPADWDEFLWEKKQ